MARPFRKQLPSSLSSRLALALAILQERAHPRPHPPRDIIVAVEDDDGSTVPPAGEGGAPAFAGAADTRPRDQPRRHRWPID